MMWNRKRAFVAAFALIAVTNAVVLLGAAYNRSGEPDSTVRLSERELQPPYYFAKRENSGLDLQLLWRTAGVDGPYYDGARYGTTMWLDKSKMAELGFDVAMPDDAVDTGRSFKRQAGRDALIVLELDGPAYQQSVADARAAAEKMRPKSPEEAAKMLQRELTSSSRLFAVDAGLDAARLRGKYADRSRYAIVGGQVAPSYDRSSTARSHMGYVSGLNIDSINVPLEHRPAFEGAARDYTRDGPSARYEAVVAFGKRLEPWIVSASRNK